MTSHTVQEKKVCVFGIYDRAYAHNRMLIRGLEQNGFVVEECHVDPKLYTGIKKYNALVRHAKALAHTEYTFILVMFPGHTVVWLARILFPKSIIVFDAFVSLYDSNVFDRARYAKGSICALRDWLLDWSSTAIASRVLLDTNAHIDYFVRTFRLSRKKCIRLFVGSDEEVFVPHAETIQSTPFTVHFHGTYIPLQGVQYILEAARLLQHKDMYFRILGSSLQEKAGKEVRTVAADLVESGVVEFVDAVPYTKLADYMADSHVCLGIFGDTHKTQRVIPNKVYEALAMGRPLVTADTPAIRELLSDDTAVLVPAADPKALAEALRGLQADPQKRRAIGQAGAELFRENLTAQKLVAHMLESLNIATLTS